MLEKFGVVAILVIFALPVFYTGYTAGKADNAAPVLRRINYCFSGLFAVIACCVAAAAVVYLRVSY
jgi:hypothetical protein